MRRTLICSLLLACGCLGGPATSEQGTGNVEEGPGPGATATRIDRMARVEVANFMLCFRPYCKDDSIKDTYNAEDPFGVSATNLTSYRNALQEGLSRLDGFDGGFGGDDDWANPHPLIDLLLQDYLVVDVSKTCTVDSPSYLALELAAYAGVPSDSCGGRTPNDDVIDRTLTLMINGPDRMSELRTDGVTHASNPASAAFPYLAEPHIGL